MKEKCRIRKEQWLFSEARWNLHFRVSNHSDVFAGVFFEIFLISSLKKFCRHVFGTLYLCFNQILQLISTFSRFDALLNVFSALESPVTFQEFALFIKSSSWFSVKHRQHLEAAFHSEVEYCNLQEKYFILPNSALLLSSSTCQEFLRGERKYELFC